MLLIIYDLVYKLISFVVEILHVLWRIQNGTLKGLSPKLVVLMIGTNNLKSGNIRVPPPYVAEGVKAVIDEILKRLPNTRILLMGILFQQRQTP